MTPTDFVDTLRGKGGHLLLSEDGARVRLRAPWYLVTPKIGRYIERHKSELLELLREQQQSATKERQTEDTETAPRQPQESIKENEPDPLIREAYLSAAARMGRLPACLSPALRLPSGRVVSNVNVFVRGSVARWRHAQAQEDRQALAYAGMTWQDVAAQEAADLACLMDRFAAAEAICTDTCGVRTPQVSGMAGMAGIRATSPRTFWPTQHTNEWVEANADAATACPETACPDLNLEFFQDEQQQRSDSHVQAL